MSDGWIPHHTPASGGIAASAAGRDRRGSELDSSEHDADAPWPIAARVAIMIGAAAGCWAALGLLVYFLW